MLENNHGKRQRTSKEGLTEECVSEADDDVDDLSSSINTSNINVENNVKMYTTKRSNWQVQCFLDRKEETQLRNHNSFSSSS